eukprot:2029854-Pyramimonas_sp.AAC.1
MFLALQRPGWEMPEFNRLQDNLGNVRELFFTSPALLRIHLRAVALRRLERDLARKRSFVRGRLCHDVVSSH